MVIRKRGILAFIGICALGVIVKLFWLPTAEIHYRLTAYFETPGGASIAASGVWAVRYSTTSGLLPDVPEIRTKISGDAIKIDKGDGLPLWIVLSSGVNCSWKKSDNTYNNGPAGIIDRSFGIKPTWSRQKKLFSLPVPGATSEVDVCDLPQIVTFAADNKPSSVRPVLFDRNRIAICCGIIFKQARIEIIDNNERITKTNIRDVFPWIPEARQGDIETRVYVPNIRQEDYPEFSLADTSLSIRGF